MLELCGMKSAPLLPLLPGSLRFGVVTPDWVLSMCQAVYLCSIKLIEIEVYAYENGFGIR